MSYCISLVRNGNRIYVSREINYGPASKEITTTQNQALLFHKENEARKFINENFLNELGFFVWFCAAIASIQPKEPKEDKKTEKDEIKKMWDEMTPDFLKN